VIDEITSIIEDFGLKPEFRTNVIPPEDDVSTLFVIAGMQPLKHRFASSDGCQYASFQSCIRTNDLNQVGDGMHLTSFTMVGTFGFGSRNYEEHCALWDRVVRRLGIRVDVLRFHPDSSHQEIWNHLGYKTEADTNCVWRASESDEDSYCSEMFVGDVEIGNLVNPGHHSVDVGFGLERLVALVEGVSTVDASTLFDQRLPPVARDHKRTLELLYANGIRPGNKGRQYVCRRLLRRLIREAGNFRDFNFAEMLEEEIRFFNQRLSIARRAWRRQQHQDASFWWETHGILPEEMDLVKN
jgi:alanyl-tRNA synthetase